MTATAPRSAESIGSSRSSVNNRVSTPAIKPGRLKLQLKDGMLHEPGYRSLPRGTRDVLDALWQMADAPLGSSPYVLGRCRIRTLADRAGMGYRNAQLCLAQLRRQGWVTTQTNGPRTQNRGLCFAVFASPNVATQDRLSAAGGVSRDASRGTRKGRIAQPIAHPDAQPIAHPDAQWIAHPLDTTFSPPPPPPPPPPRACANVSVSCSTDAPPADVGGGGGVVLAVEATPAVPAVPEPTRPPEKPSAASDDPIVVELVQLGVWPADAVQLAQTDAVKNAGAAGVRATYADVKRAPGIKNPIAVLVSRCRRGELVTPSKALPIGKLPAVEPIDTSDVLVGEARRRAFAGIWETIRGSTEARAGVEAPTAERSDPVPETTQASERPKRRSMGAVV